MIGLKPCPFCGGKAEIVSMGNGKYSVSCVTGGCMANISWCSNAESAVKAWNTRASGWIPFSERPPENRQNVLCYMRDEQGYEEMFVDIYFTPEDKLFWNESSILSKDTTHWMPLPEPPEMDG